MTKKQKLEIYNKPNTKLTGIRMPVDLVKLVEKEQKKRRDLTFTQTVLNLLWERIESIDNTNG